MNLKSSTYTVRTFFFWSSYFRELQIKCMNGRIPHLSRRLCLLVSIGGRRRRRADAVRVQRAVFLPHFSSYPLLGRGGKRKGGQLDSR